MFLTIWKVFLFQAFVIIVNKLAAEYRHRVLIHEKNFLQAQIHGFKDDVGFLNREKILKKHPPQKKIYIIHNYDCSDNNENQ